MNMAAAWATEASISFSSRGTQAEHHIQVPVVADHADELIGCEHRVGSRDPVRVTGGRRVPRRDAVARPGLCSKKIRAISGKRRLSVTTARYRSSAVGDMMIRR